MKPLARWTIGNVGDSGFNTLKRSVYLFKKIYPEFDCIVCYNEIDSFKIRKLKFSYDVKNYFQHHFCCNIHVKPTAINAWKLFPPRLRLSSHELFIDNDLVLHKRLPQIDQFLNSNFSFLCYAECDRDYHAYGSFNSYVKKNFRLNSGIFGLPPQYDFEKEIINLLNMEGIEKWGVFDEQGIIASIMSSKNNVIVIPQRQVSCCWKEYTPAEYGCHFCESNFKKSNPLKEYNKLKVFL